MRKLVVPVDTSTDSDTVLFQRSQLLAENHVADQKYTNV